MRPLLVVGFVVVTFAASLRGFDTSHIAPSSALPSASTAATMDSSATSVYTSPSPVIKCDVHCCNCKGIQAKCEVRNGQKVNYLPRLPAKIRDFWMVGADLQNLTRSMMANLSNFDITAMNLIRNNVSYIEATAFADFPKLESLDLSGNPIPMQELHAALRGITSTFMHTLTLGAMELASLPDDFFGMFLNKTFKKVNLQQNHLKSFNNAIFAAFWEVGVIDISSNELSEVNMTAQVNTGKLILRDNEFQQFPDLCLHRSPTTGKTGYFRAFHSLTAIFISDNPFKQIHPSTLRGDCLPSLKKLDISGSDPLKTLEDNFIADLPKLEDIVVDRMKLKRYERYAFNSSSLKSLSLSKNERLDRKVVDIPNMFSYCPNLEQLRIVSTKLEMDTGEFRVLLLQLQSVTNLNIQQVRQNSIPEDLLWRLPSLQKLQFSASNVNSTSLGRALINVTKLHQLSVRANRITVVNENTLPWEFRRNLTFIDLAHNPFNCTCDLLWFRRWLDEVSENKSVAVHNYPSKQYRCFTPASMINTPLRDFHPTAKMCSGNSHPTFSHFPVGFVVGCVLAGLVAVVFAHVYRHRSHLGGVVLRLRRRRQYGQISGECSSSEQKLVISEDLSAAEQELL